MISDMHALYSFDFLDAITKQLQESLDGLEATILNDDTLAEFSQFQTKHGRKQGVYVVYYKESPVYIGKAENLAESLSHHYRKLTGRRNIDLGAIGYKSLILDDSVSSAANEKLLISRYKEIHGEMKCTGI